MLFRSEAARDAVRNIAKRQIGRITIINRTLEHAERLAAECGATACSWPAVENKLLTADVVIVATAAEQPIVRREMLDRVLALRHGRPLLVVDLGSPRNVEPGSAVSVLDVDQIREQQEEVLERRTQSIPRVEAIVSDALAVWQQRRACLPLESIIRRLYANVSDSSQELVRELERRRVSDNPNELEEIVRRGFKRFLHDHVESLRKLNAAAVFRKTEILQEDTHACNGY